MKIKIIFLAFILMLITCGSVLADDMPDELKAKQEEKAIKQAVKFLKKTRLCCKLTTSCFLPCKYILLQGLFVMDIFLCFQFLILSRY